MVPLLRWRLLELFVVLEEEDDIDTDGDVTSVDTDSAAVFTTTDEEEDDEEEVVENE